MPRHPRSARPGPRLEVVDDARGARAADRGLGSLEQVDTMADQAADQIEIAVPDRDVELPREHVIAERADRVDRFGVGEVSGGESDLRDTTEQKRRQLVRA